MLDKRLNFNEAGAAGTASALAMDLLQKRLIPVSPKVIKNGVTISLDSVDRVLSELFYQASVNESKQPSEEN